MNDDTLSWVWREKAAVCEEKYGYSVLDGFVP